MIINFISKLYSLYTPSFFISGGGSAGGYVIERSLRFDADFNQYLTRTHSASGTTNTWSFWIKRATLGVRQVIAGFSDGSTTSCRIEFTAGDAIEFTNVQSSTTNIRKTSTRLFRDVSAWYHIVINLDTTNATPEDRTRIYVNNERITSFSSTTNASLNLNTTWGSTRAFTIGNQNNTLKTDGYIAEYRMIVGQAIAPSEFGTIEQSTGQWVARKYTGSYGSEGFFLDFKDATTTTTLGQDKSGNNNHWILNNFTAIGDVNDCRVIDVPSGNSGLTSANYPIFNVLDNSGSSTLSGVNLKFSRGATHGLSARSSFALPSTGKFYVELIISQNTSGSSGIGLALVSGSSPLTGTQGSGGEEYGLYGYQTNLVKCEGGITSPIFPVSLTAGKVIQLAIDIDLGYMWIGINDVWSDGTTTGTSGNPSLSLNPTIIAQLRGLFVVGRALSNGGVINFGQRTFSYTPPTGFKSLNSVNTTTTIKNPNNHFGVSLSAGSNIKSVTEALFANQLVWIKARTYINNHQLIDSVRGTNAVLQSNTNSIETLYDIPLGSSVGLSWRASNNVAVANVVGTIPSQVSANPSAGFSIVTYTGTGISGSVGHSLGVAPSVILTMRRDLSSDWQMYHSSLGLDKTLQLNQTATVSTIVNYWANGVNSSVFGVNGSQPAINASGGTYVAYCFASISGYSKFGSYTGNASANGPFINLEFKPAFIMIKRTNAVSAWTMFDNKRDGYNENNFQLYANTPSSEATTILLDLTSNGFKIRSTNASINASGGNYIYMAFAESPFQYSNAR